MDCHGHGGQQDVRRSDVSFPAERFRTLNSILDFSRVGAKIKTRAREAKAQLKHGLNKSNDWCGSPPGAAFFDGDKFGTQRRLGLTKARAAFSFGADIKILTRVNPDYLHLSRGSYLKPWP